MGGTVEGRADHIILNGHLVNYEPFWVRTFRFIVVKSSDGMLPMRENMGSWSSTELPTM